MLLHLLIRFACNIFDLPLFTGGLFRHRFQCEVWLLSFVHAIFLQKRKTKKLPPPFDPFSFENRVNMSLSTPLSTFAAAADWVGFLTLRLFRFSNWPGMCFAILWSLCSWLGWISTVPKRWLNPSILFAINHGDCHSPQFNDKEWGMQENSHVM